MEELVLSDPVTVPAQTTATYKVRGLMFDWDALNTVTGAKGLVVITLQDNLGGSLVHTYEGQTAIDYMKFINTANFSTKSLTKRILERLSTEGVIPGTVTGAPDP